MSATNNSSFVAFEHKDVLVRRNMEEIYADAYPSFGWTPDGRGTSLQSITSVSLKFKRDRKLVNRAELSALQREFESHAAEIERMENAKVITPSVVAYTVGLAGTALLAGATFAYMASMIPLCVILAVPGFIGWALTYFIYQRVKRRKIAKVAPVIDRNYDAIYAICDKASALLHA